MERTDNLPAPLGGFGVGIEGVEGTPDQVRIRIPHLKPIMGALTAEQIKGGWIPGEWKMGKARLLGPSVEVVLLRAMRVRHYDQKVDGLDYAQIFCASQGAKRPLANVYEQQAELCAECPVGDWTDHPTKKNDDGTAKRVPPKCKAGWAFLGVLPSRAHDDAPLDVLPFWLTCDAAGSDPIATKFLNSMLPEEGIKQLFGTTVVLTSEEHSNGGITWYVPVFALGRRLDPARFRPYRDAAADWTYPFFLYRPGHEQTPPPDDGDVPPPNDEDIPF